MRIGIVQDEVRGRSGLEARQAEIGKSCSGPGADGLAPRHASSCEHSNLINGHAERPPTFRASWAIVKPESSERR
jgi:hypothetical protein